jgi:hypothetical protein
MFQSTFKKPEAAKSTTTEHEKGQEQQAKWLQRLMWGGVCGLSIIVIYALRFRSQEIALVASVGLMTAGAAWLCGALTGFLFGIPHARQQAQASKVQSAGKETNGSNGEGSEDSRYSPSTSLEQIADWLTKIIVGVGLTQLNKIPNKLDLLAGYVAGGMGGDPGGKPFALAICIYYSVGGFLFGFLWSRLQMLRAFADAEILKQMKEIKKELDFDNEAMNLVSRQLALDAERVPNDQLEQAVCKASPLAKAAIFEKTKEVRHASDATNDAKNRACDVFRALVAADTEHYDHESHAQLAYNLQDLGKVEQSVKELTEAIDIRNRQGKSGWTYYEYKRARGNIRLDTDSPSKPEILNSILSDLRIAYKDQRRPREDFQKPEIQNWLKKNNLDAKSLES